MMTKEERQGLCENLRDPWRGSLDELVDLADAAAHEIEQLARRVEELEAPTWDSDNKEIL